MFEGSRRYLVAARDAGLRRAVVSSSANTAAGPRRHRPGPGTVEVLVDGVTVADRAPARQTGAGHVPGRGRRLGVAPDRAAVFEDAIAGVEAGRAGGFGCVVGVDRIGHADELRAHGADVVVNDLAELLAEVQH